MFTKFGGWIGKNQKSFYEDAGSPGVCYGDAAHCPSAANSTTRGACRSEGFDISGTWDVPIRIPGLSLTGNYNRSWSECNERAEEISCPPKVHSKYSPAILVGERWGLTHITGANSSWFQNGRCEAGYKKVWMGGPNFRCEYNGAPYDKTGYLPEFRYRGCQYTPI
ncbi:hypothetical protein JWH11_16625 [Xanthomonas melonis]|uniref:Uncharacterized protein n=2 Tax=Xanthomonas melonis TaxID=56456 RepID=A0ABS8NY51_9XANT|nr:MULTISPECIES: hypothetical protein [Xanthomonas]MCC4587254.1 hypothetical protein [Xanthomonas sp. NCPPB 1067]MCD0259466.1 hypothetical protein [Xanthomonas melonis]MCD0268019.1 hypothetical protein [Xanthomonas melonis]MCD0280702.1 hypothetical protein [Xanthomonas melonis]